MKSYIVLFFVISIVALSSCTISTHYLQSDAKEYAPTQPDVVKVYSSVPDAKFDVIASISAYGTTHENSLEAFKEKAAEFGGNAIINTKLYLLRTNEGTRLGYSGVAVRTK